MSTDSLQKLFLRGVLPRRDIETYTESINTIGYAWKCPGEFWNQSKGETIEHLSEFLQVSDSPSLEVMTPVHANGRHLPVFLWSLSRQTLRDPRVTLSFLLHNADNMSRDIAEEVCEALPGRTRILRVDDQLLSGAYYAWQLLSCLSEGETVVVVDADSALFPDWMFKLRRDLSEFPSAVAATGRRLSDSRTRKGVARTVGGNLLPGISNHYIGGNSMTRGDVLRDIVYGKLLGGLGADLAFERIVKRKYGPQAFRFTDAVAICEKGSWSPKLVTHVLWREMDRLGFVDTPWGAAYDRRHDLTTHCPGYVPWTKQIIDTWLHRGCISIGEVHAALSKFIEDRRIYSSPHADRAFESLSKNHHSEEQIVDLSQLVGVLQEIVETCFRPAMEEAILNVRQAGQHKRE